MSKSLALAAVVALATICTSARAACDDVNTYFSDLEPNSEVDLGDVTRIECPANDLGGPLEEVLIASGTSLTIKSSESFVRFVNVRFTVQEGASLTFDMQLTRFGPNSGATEGGTLYMCEVDENASVIFTGKFRGIGVRNIRSMFFNSGSIEFQGRSVFKNNGNVFRSNENGTIKFRGNTVFRDNSWLALDLIGPDSFVRFSKKATFDNNASGFDGATGCAVDNSEGTVIFRGAATFKNHRCDEGSAVFNGGDMTFHDEVFFEDNVSQSDWGGGMRNGADGYAKFKAAVQFNRNEAERGGGLAVSGGEVIFKTAVAFNDNIAEETGGAFAVTVGSQYGTSTDAGSLIFDEPSGVSYSGNTIDDSAFNDESEFGCNLAYVEDGTTLVGFDVDDVCEEDVDPPN